MKKSTILEFRGVEFDIEYYYNEPELSYLQSDGEFSAPYPASVDIDLISHKGTNFNELMDDFTAELEELILSKHE